MCHQSSLHLSTDEAPEKSLLVYCKPVELYNILQRRSSKNPSFLQRCLSYKIQAKRKRRLNAGNVIFTYGGYSKLVRKIEVTEEFTCPFCLMQCASFKGLRYHLCSSHDLFNFEFWVTEEYQAVSVSVKIDLFDSQIIADGVHPHRQAFFFCSNKRKRSKLEELVQNSKNVFPQFVETDATEPVANGICNGNLEKSDDGSYREGEKIIRSFPNEKELQNGWHGNVTEGTDYILPSIDTLGVSIATAQSYPDSEIGCDTAQPAMVQSAKARKLSAEQTASRNRMLLQKQQYFHSHRAQPMSLDQVLSDRDSEDEVDEIADFEDRRMLDDFVDVTKDEKHFMHLWNSFVRKQRVLADGHVPWACKAFSELHGQELVKVPALFWCWRLFMIKLWNHGLLDASTMNDCNIVLESFQKEALNMMSS